MKFDLSILVVEDVDEKRLELVEHLKTSFQRVGENRGFSIQPRIRAVPNAVEAQSWLIRETYDWVILDEVLGIGETGDQLKERNLERAGLWIWHSAYKRTLESEVPYLSKPLEDFELDLKLEGWLISYSKLIGRKL